MSRRFFFSPEGSRFIKIAWNRQRTQRERARSSLLVPAVFHTPSSAFTGRPRRRPVARAALGFETGGKARALDDPQREGDGLVAELLAPCRQSSVSFPEPPVTPSRPSSR